MRNLLLRKDADFCELVDLVSGDDELEEETRLRLPFVSEPPIHDAEWTK
jgi:hypothetical protein